MQQKCSEYSSFNDDCLDAIYYCQNLVNFAYALLNKYFPLKTKTMTNKRLLTTWLTKDVIKCIDKIHARFRNVRSRSITLPSYKQY